jgi:hypothetical protein
MKNTSSIKKIVILSSLFLMAVLILVFLFALPLFNEIQKYSQSIIEKNAELSFFEKEAVRSREFEKNKTSLNSDIEKIDNSFAKSQAPIDLIKFWEQMAKFCNLSIEMSPVPSQIIADAEEMGFNLQIKGSFPNTLKFVEKIENGPYLIQIQDYSSVQGESGINTEIKITVFAK